MPTRYAPIIFACAIWSAAVVALFIGDKQWAMLAIATFGYAAVLFAITAWAFRKEPRMLEGDVLVAPAPSVRSLPRYILVAATILWVFAYGFVFSGFRIPLASPWVHLVVPLHVGPARWLNGLTFQNFLTFAVLPGILIFLLGARPRELGLCKSAPGTWRAMALSWLLPIVYIILGFVHGLNAATLVLMLLHNLLSNGFTEEFFARGLVFSHLRALQTTTWALVTQALIFALLHAGGTVADEHGNAVLVAANVIGMNFPMGITLGYMALRSRSLLLPSAVHVSLDTMKDLVGL